VILDRKIGRNLAYFHNLLLSTFLKFVRSFDQKLAKRSPLYIQSIRLLQICIEESCIFVQLISRLLRITLINKSRFVPVEWGRVMLGNRGVVGKDGSGSGVEAQEDL